MNAFFISFGVSVLKDAPNWPIQQEIYNVIFTDWHTTSYIRLKSHRLTNQFWSLTSCTRRYMFKKHWKKPKMLIFVFVVLILITTWPHMSYTCFSLLFYQNQNEAINSTLWKKCPKSVFSGKEKLLACTAQTMLQWNRVLVDLWIFFVLLNWKQ